METNRLINEKYWSKFINIDPETGKKTHDGHMFEKLIERLLTLMYQNLKWKSTQMTHDGNKDFKTKNGEDIYWAECKNYQTKIDLKTLATTLVMAEIENVNSIFFFCYSEINNSTKTKLNSYSRSNQKNIFFYDGIVLDQLIIKYQNEIFPQFFPELQEIINDIDISAILSAPIALCYLERNPFFNGTPEFDMQDLTELQNLKLGEMVGIHIIIINTDLNNSINCSIKLTFPKAEKYFELLINEKSKEENRDLFSNMELPAGATIRKTFYLRLHSWAPKVSLPHIVCKVKRKTIGNFKFPLISTQKTRQTAFLGSSYINEADYLYKGCLNQKKVSVIFIYGSSGTGKSRMIAECTVKFVRQGYHIIKLVNSEHSKHSTFIMLKELIFSLYGFSDEIIEHIINNSYETLENYNYNSYKEIFEIIKLIYENRYSLSQIKNLEYSVLFEKMAKGKYFLVADDIQYWDEQAVSFLKNFYQYTISMQRKCNTVIGIVTNTDVLYNQNTIEFLTDLLSKNNNYDSNIYTYNLTGFETVNQSYLFLKEILGIEDDFCEIEELTDFSLKPKYLTEVANYLQDVSAIEIVNNKAIVADKSFLKKSIKKLPLTLQAILEKRWMLFLKNMTKDEIIYKKIISSLLFLGKVRILNDSFGIFHKKEIEDLLHYGFLKKDEFKDNIYTFEHDSIKFYFKECYKDWFETAVSYLKNKEHNFLKGHRLENICDFYVKPEITKEQYYNYMDTDYPEEIIDKINERVFCFALKNDFKAFFNLIQDILKKTREKFGEKRAEKFYEIFVEQYDFNSKQLSCEEYCTIMMNYAENQLKLKSTEKAIKIYEFILNIIDANPFPQKEYLLAKVNNRYFVCGRVGTYINQYSEKWNHSMDISLKNDYHDICIENYFDKAHSLFLDNKSFRQAIEYLKKGCYMYEIYQPQGLRGQYLYRDIQCSFLKKEYTILKDRIWRYEEEIANDNSIEFKLYFRIQFLIFKIILFLMDKKEYSDFEMENMLEQLNIFQTMQNNLQLYRYLYLCGKYYAQKHEWEKAYLFYQKTFDNLAKNKDTEEIRLQRIFIAQDMIINFKKRKFPFAEYNMSYIDSIVKGTAFEKVYFLTDEEFSVFFDKYVSLAPISNESTKEGFLLF